MYINYSKFYFYYFFASNTTVPLGKVVFIKILNQNFVFFAKKI